MEKMRLRRKAAAWAVLALQSPIWVFLWVFSLMFPRLPAWVTRKLLLRTENYMNTHDMDFRIPPDKNVPAYMLRWWWIPRNSFFNVYLHRVHRSDDDRALHDHPWINFSIVLDGGYYEEMIREGGIHTKTWFAPGSVRFRGSGKIAHRLELPEGINAKHDWHGIPQEFPMELPATTIFITGPVMRRWGFHHPSRWVDAYEWDQFCEDNNVAGMRMDGGSDGQLSERNKLA